MDAIVRAGQATQRPPATRSRAPAIPDYMLRTWTYRWAYLKPISLRIFDHPFVVSTILWGWAGRLRRAALAEMRGADAVLQPACVYGDFSARLARFLGPRARLDITDVAPLQVANCRRKLRGFPGVSVRLADAAAPGGGPYDAICCFFLLHEVPDGYKGKIVDSLISKLRPGGKAVFVDYHRPHPAHPLKPLTWLVFRFLEPFAHGLWDNGIAAYATPVSGIDWRTETYFGGLFQKTVATRT